MTEEQKEAGMTLDIQQIMELIPHRYPFLLVDRIEDIVPGESCVGVKNVTINEPFFPGHFPQEPVMPGVLMLEAMAQTAGCVALVTLGEESHGRSMYFMAIDGVKFRRKVIPGDVLKMHVTKDRGKPGAAVWKFSAVGYVDGEKAVEAKLTAMIGDR